MSDQLAEVQSKSMTNVTLTWLRRFNKLLTEAVHALDGCQSPYRTIVWRSEPQSIS
jgi:hypothetical protein